MTWKQRWKEGATQTVAAAIRPITDELNPKPGHVCDPTGFNCDCARKRAINAASAASRRRWITERPSWLRTRRWP
jgi:hypothetical protein